MSNRPIGFCRLVAVFFFFLIVFDVEGTLLFDFSQKGQLTSDIVGICPSF